MEPGDNRLAAHQARLADLWERMVNAIGVHTVNVLFERAIWEASQKHPELAHIQSSDEGISFGPLAGAYAARPEPEIAGAFGDLASALVLILARLLGRQMARRLVEDIAAWPAPGGRPPEQEGRNATPGSSQGE